MIERPVAKGIATGATKDIPAPILVLHTPMRSLFEPGAIRLRMTLPVNVTVFCFILTADIMGNPGDLIAIAVDDNCLDAGCIALAAGDDLGLRSKNFRHNVDRWLEILRAHGVTI